jgi:outer membrane protein assembly factor BamB
MYVYCSVNGVIGVGAEGDDQGKTLWKTSAWAHGVTSPSPIRVDDQRIFLTVGYGGGSMMLRLLEKDGSIVTEPGFELDKKTFSCEQQTPIFHENHLFSIIPNDGGAMRNQFVCLNTEGKTVWSSGKSQRFGFGPFLVADGKVFILNDNGELTLIRASVKGYEKLAQAKPLKGRDAWAPMALVDGKLVLRDSETVICLDVRAKGPQT